MKKLLIVAAMAAVPFACGTAVAAVHVMGGTFVPTPSHQLLDQIDKGYLEWVGVDEAPRALWTPEQFSDQSYLDGEAELLAAWRDDPNGTFIGYSQSAGIIGMLLNNEDVTSGNFVAFAPPNMPDSGIFTNGSGTGDWFSSANENFPFQVNDGVTVSVYCGEYDPVCNPLPSGNMNLLASLNSMMASTYVHNLYPSLTAEDFAQAVPIDYGTDGNVDFYMLPNQDDILPLFQGMTWFAPDLALEWSDLYRDQITAAYDGTALFDTMLIIDGLGG